MIQRILQFLNRDLWRIRGQRSKGPKGILLRFLRIFVVSFREFTKDKCALHASALTYYSLLSIVPVFAMAFGLAKGFGLDKLLRDKLMENMEGQQEVMGRIIEFSENMLQNTKGGIIAGVGLALLFWTVIKVLANIEASFNEIWGIQKQRSWGQKFTDYLSLMLIAPLFFIVGSSATVFVVSQVTLITAKIAILGVFAPVILTALKVLPYAVFWSLLTYLYMFIPNSKIQFKSALLGGIVGGTIYQIVQWTYIHSQIVASQSGTIYGSFAALPLFLVWLQTSWTIVLYGAELSFAHQNDQAFEFIQDCRSASQETKKLLALRIAQHCVSRFTEGLPPLSADTLSDTLEIPIRLTRELLQNLTEAGILSVVQTENERVGLYQPARDVAEMTVQFVIDRLEKNGTSDIPVAETPELEKLRQSLAAFHRAVENLPENAALKDLGLLAPIPSR